MVLHSTVDDKKMLYENICTPAAASCGLKVQMIFATDSLFLCTDGWDNTVPVKVECWALPM